MEHSKFKICPECGKHNPPSLLECRYCEADLTGVKVVDGETVTQEAPAPSDGTIPADTPDKTELVRICDCGAENPPQARKCRACGEDISDIIPSQIEKKAQKPFAYELKSVDGAFSSLIDKPLIVVGREAIFKDYLAERVYVSRQHARFTVVADKVFVENLSRTNKTFLNNEEIQDATPTAICDGDEIGLGGKVINGSRQDKAAYFVFQVRK